MRNERSCKNGQTLVLVTLAILTIFGLLGLLVDFGWMHFRQEAAQTAADAAAAAAVQAALAYSAGSYTCGSNNVGCQTSTLCPNPLHANPTNTLDIACAYAKTNGFAVTSGGRQSVYVGAGAGTSPPTAPGVTVGYWVTVIVAENIPQLFSAVLGNPLGTVSARATAAASGTTANSCVYALDPAMKAAFSASGGATVNASCGIFVNSNNAGALEATGGATVNTSAAKVVGGYKITGGARVSPTPRSGATAAVDPFAALAAPTYSGCNYTGKSTGGGATVTLSPGVYCNGLSLQGGSTVTLQPGVYIIDGGGFSTGGGAVVNGTGVTIFNTARSYSYQPFTIGGGSKVTLTAPTTGTYRGVLFYNDRTINSGNSNSFQGGADLQLTGSLYFPSTPVSYAGGSATTVTAIIAKSVNFSGGAYLAQDLTGTKTGLGSVHGNLIE
jgi:hypothetical protein